MSTDRFYDSEGPDGELLVMVRDEGFVRPASALELDLRAERDLLAEALGERDELLRVLAVAEFNDEPREPQRITLDVACRADGFVTVTADPTTMARVAGRECFGPAEPVRAALLDKIADAWYGAGCPQAPR